MKKAYHFKIVRIVNNKMQTMNYVGPAEGIPTGWSFCMRRIREVKKNVGIK